jgi:hypothetical protein
MKLSHLIFCLLLLSSCAFEPEGLNFVEVEKPAAWHPMEMTLSMNEDSIYLYGDTKLSINLNTFGAKINVVSIRYYDQKLSTDQLSYSFTISPQETNDWTNLTIDFYASTGSGSIADKLKVENYIMSRTWKIKYFDLNKEGLNSGYKINPDGYLEIYMVKPKIKEFIGYGMSKYGNSIPESRLSGDTVFFADKSYCAGATTYNLWYRFDSNHIISRDVTVNLPKAELKVEAIGLDSCRVTWSKSPLKLYYTINDTEYKGFGNEFKTSILVSGRKYFSLLVFSPDYLTQRFSSYSVSAYFNFGIQANYFICYSLEKDKFFISKDLNLPYIESPGLPLPADDPNSLNKARVNIICSPNGKYIAGYLESQIFVYNENLSLSKKIAADNIPNYRPYFSITNDGVFTYLQGATIVMKNLTGSTDWDSFSFATDSDPNPNVVYFSVIANSIDGKYVCVRGMSGFKIYDVSDHKTAKMVYNYPLNEIGAVVAHPTNPGLIYVKQNGIMQLRTCPGFELIKTIDIPVSNYYFHSIDPYSNVMLMMKDDYYYFIDPNTSKELLKLKSGSIWYYDVKLVRNQFKAYNNILDLINYLKK